MAKLARRTFATGKAFDATAHPRGPGGQFVQTPGGPVPASQYTAAHGGKVSDVTDADIITFAANKAVVPGKQNFPTKGLEGRRFSIYKDGMSVREAMDAAEVEHQKFLAGSGPRVFTDAQIAAGTQKQVLKDLAWASGRTWVRFDPPGAGPSAHLQGTFGIARTTPAPPTPKPPPGATPATPPASRRPDDLLTDAEAMADPVRRQAVTNAVAYWNKTRGQVAGDRAFTSYMNDMGLNKSPVVDKAQFDQLKGELIIRGVSGAADPNMVRAQYDHDPAGGAPAFIGNGIYGNGQYYGWRTEMDVSWGYANQVPPGHVWMSKLDPSAKLVAHSHLEQEYNYFVRSAAFKKLPTDEQAYFTSDGGLGRYGAFRGYDGIDIAGQNPTVGPKTPNTYNPQYLNLWNKTKITVSAESLPGGAYDVQAGQPSPPDPTLVRARDTAQNAYVQASAAVYQAAQSGQLATAQQLTTLTTAVNTVNQMNARITAAQSVNKADNLKRIFRQQYGY